MQKVWLCFWCGSVAFSWQMIFFWQADFKALFNEFRRGCRLCGGGWQGGIARTSNGFTTAGRATGAALKWQPVRCGKDNGSSLDALHCASRFTTMRAEEDGDDEEECRGGGGEPFVQERGINQLSFICAPNSFRSRSSRARQLSETSLPVSGKLRSVKI